MRERRNGKNWENWKNWFFPALTVLLVAGLALLPLRLSLLEDGKLVGVVHSEELGEDSNFPALPPDLPGRVWLLTQRESLPEGLTIMDRELTGEELAEAAALAEAELRRLEAAGILPAGAAPQSGDAAGNLVYLRDQSDLSSASFLELNVSEQGSDTYFWLYLDRESGRVLALEMVSGPLHKFHLNTEEAGRAFLDRLDVEYQLTSAIAKKGYGEVTEAVFSLPDSRSLYTIRQGGDILSIWPQVDWETLDALARDGAVMDASVKSALGYAYDG